MSGRAIDLRLKPTGDHGKRVELVTFTYSPTDDRWCKAMSESVYIDLRFGRNSFGTELTPDEARVLANQLLQVADVADEQRAARVADDELQASFDEISEELRNAEELGSTGCCYYAHPDVYYVPADQVEAKVRELNEAGVKRFMVLVEPSLGAAA